MARLTIIQQRSKFSMNIPHKILVDGQFVGVIQGRQLQMELPAGSYQVTVQSMVPLFYATQQVEVRPRSETRLAFADRERVWDALMVVDLGLWLLKRFLHLAAPWTWLYEVFTNGYFVLWLLYEWHIRHRYFRFQTL